MQFDYEFNFHTRAFDPIVYNACTLTDNIGDRATVIQDFVNKIIKTLVPIKGFKTCSSYIDHDVYKYKVTINMMVV
jgi:hypothetical protein